MTRQQDAERRLVEAIRKSLWNGDEYAGSSISEVIEEARQTIAADPSLMDAFGEHRGAIRREAFIEAAAKDSAIRNRLIEMGWTAPNPA